MANGLTAIEFKNNMVANVMNELNLSGKQIALPKNYAAQNALASALVILDQTVDKNGKPVLQVCTTVSVKQALQDMVIKGLNPSKNQGYFIAYGTRLAWMTSYFGHICQVKAVDPNIADVFAVCVYEGDEFAYEIKRGKKIVSKHVQKPENVDSGKIKGAYATIIYKDDTEISEYMNINQIHTSWQFGQTEGKSKAHTRTPEEMCKRTVTNRLTKPIINGSDDSQLDTWEQLEQEVDLNSMKEIVDIPMPEEIMQDNGYQEPEEIDIPDPVQPAQITQTASRVQAQLDEPGF